MSRTQAEDVHRYDTQVEPGEAGQMVKEVLEHYGHSVSAIVASSADAAFDAKDNRAMTGEAEVQLAADEHRAYRSATVDYEIKPTHTAAGAGYDFSELMLTVWLPK